MEIQSLWEVYLVDEYALDDRGHRIILTNFEKQIVLCVDSKFEVPDDVNKTILGNDE